MKTEKAILTFCGGTGNVTGANFLLEIAGKKILVDCGLVQGGSKTCDEKFCGDENRRPFPYDPKTIDYLFITHAHLDHIGRIAKLVKEGFKGTIISTPETRRLTEIMLEDSTRILEKEALRSGEEPLYTADDMHAVFPLWQSLSYHQIRSLGEVSVYLKDAGHILGSSMIEFTYNGKKIVFTGDLGNTPTPLLRDTEIITDADYLVMESVYGDRNHESHEERDRRFEEIIKESIARKGVLVIPAFSLERTQVILFMLDKLFTAKKIPSVPVYLDSPLAIKVTAIYKEFGGLDFNARVKALLSAGDDVFDFPKLHFSESTEDSKAILHSPNPKIVIAGSGMSSGGRILHHEKNYLPDPNNTLLIIGYEANGTLGRLLQDGAKSVTIYGEQVPVASHIEMISGFSSHKDSDNLLAFVSETAQTVKKVFCVMGEPKSALFLAQRLRDELGVQAVAPVYAEKVELDF